MNIDLNNDHVMCRTVGHAWFETTSPGLDPPKSGWWRLSIACERCTTERHDLINRRTGVLEGRRYVCPDDYQRDRGAPRLFRDALRVELLKRRSDSAKRKAS